MFSLKDQCALVTGASGGIGRQIAHGLASQGAHLVISGTRETILNELAQEIEAAHKVKVVVKTCALDNPESVEALFPAAEEALGKIDILVNNAGITKDGLIIRMKDNDWQSVIDINLTAAFRLSRAALKSMMRARYGRIINITSVVGSAGNPGQANYCASKAGLIGMSKSMAQEVATRGITVNCVAPGFIESDMTAVLPEAVKEKILNSIPKGAMGTPEDISSAVVFLASAEAGYVTGQTLHVNGGMYMV
jgi:3-oxoacyl-[acyl-carrier protein] reductase